MVLLFLILLFFVSYVVLFSFNKSKRNIDKKIFFLCCILVLSSFLVYLIKRDKAFFDFHLSAYFALTIGPLLFLLLYNVSIKILWHLLPFIFFPVFYLLSKLFFPYSEYLLFLDTILYVLIAGSCLLYGSYGYLYMIKHELEFKKNSVVVSYILLVLSCSFFYGVLTFKPIGVFDVDYIYIFYCLLLIIVAFLDAMNSYVIKNCKGRLKIKSEAIQLLIGEQEESNLASQPELGESEAPINCKEIEVVEVCLDTKELQLSMEKEQRMMVIRQKLFEQLIESKLYLNVDLTLQKLSEVIEIDKKELSEYFKESNSISFRQYINRLRVEYAVGLIKEKNKDVTVEELTSFCGFNTRLSFYRAFVQVYGFPPSALLSK
ncbi:hypothetical protein HMPREF9713_00628 [Myroides odoratimimus CCUG 12700]|nr:hypothetical protein HMPREF9713_00628 [Myroides odoratimimus CCUG 12700]